MEYYNKECEQINNPTIYFEAINQLQAYLSENTFFYFCNHWNRLILHCSYENKLLYQEPPSHLSEYNLAYFWRLIIEEIIDRYQTYSLAKIAIITDIKLIIIQRAWLGHILKMPLIDGEKLLLLHAQARPDLCLSNH